MPRLADGEIKKYWEIFQGLKPENNKLTGEQVSPVLKNSRLKDSQLAQIWELADIDADGNLDFEEFCISMRLIFDLVNGESAELPLELPGWLIPQSKAHLIQANRAVASGNNGNQALYTDDNDDMLSNDFDWYISPTDRATYEAIYNSNSDRLGRVRFESLSDLYDTLRNVPKTDISSAWNLVNPKSFETIDKDQVLVLLHILNQRENGKRIPRGVPASLRATFSKESPNYDLSQPQKAGISQSNDKKAFGISYLDKIGRGGEPERGTDFSATEGTDWEEVRVRRELENLESLLAKALLEKTKPVSEELALLKHEFEQLLKYKQGKLDESKNESLVKDIESAKNDVELVYSQIQVLQDYLLGKEKELEGLRAEISNV